MPRLNLYEMANPFRSPRASGAEMGAAPTQALGEMGDAAFAIGERIQKREENAISDQALGEVDTQLLPLLADLEKNPANMPEALNQFQAGAQKIRADVLGKVNLRPEARAALERQIDNQLTQYGKSAIAMRIKSGINQVVARLNQQFDTGVNQVSAAPSIMKDVIDTNVAFVKARKDSMDPLMYQAAMRKAHAGPIQAAVNSYLAQQLPDKADELLQNPEINKLIDPDALRPMRINVAVEKGKQEKEKREQETNVRQWEFATGTKIDPSKYADLPDFKSSTAAQKIAQHKLVFGTDPTDEQKQKYFGIDRQVSESKIQQITDMAMDYNNLDAAGRMKLGLLIKSEYRDINGVDALGNPTRYSTVPAELQRFVEPTGGRPGAGGITGSVSTGQGTDTGPLLDSKGQMYAPGTKLTMPDGAAVTIDARGHAIADGGAAPAAPGSKPVDEDADMINLYDTADKMVGVEAWVKRNAANLPLGIGDSLKVNPAYGQAAMASKVIQNDIVRGFVNMGGGKDTIANQYRQELKNIVSIDPAIIGSDREYRIKLKTIDSELRSKLKQYEKTAQSGATQDMRTVAAEGVSVINQVLSRLDVPQKVVKEQKDYERLQPGERYLWLDDPTPRVKGGRK